MRVRAAVALRPLLLAHVVEVQAHQRVQVVLYVVFVVDHVRGTPRVSLGELPHVAWEATADVLNELERIPLAARDLPARCVRRLKRVSSGRAHLTRCTPVRPHASPRGGVGCRVFTRTVARTRSPA